MPHSVLGNLQRLQQQGNDGVPLSVHLACLYTPLLPLHIPSKGLAHMLESKHSENIQNTQHNEQLGSGVRKLGLNPSSTNSLL